MQPVETKQPPDRQAPRASKRPLRRETILLVVCITLLLLATIPPLINLGRYQRRIAGAISRAIGRPIHFSSLALQLIPWPAFKLESLTVSEDPAFGAEPALQAPEVLIEPRLLSLWRAHFEIARVELTDASVNLVRDANGRWNISSVLLNASHIPNAPTSGGPRAGHAPRFPYIEATGTRINFKRGVEKLPYSVLNADFSMWLSSPGIWSLKLEGQPLRTDIVISPDDTGTVRLEGDLHRASALGAMPLRLDAQWSHAPLGQLSRLLLGKDSGWRGDTDATAHFSGTIDQLRVRTHFVIDSLHRQEFTPQEAFKLDATCNGFYSREHAARDAFQCRWPVGDGALLLSRSSATVPPSTSQEPEGALPSTHSAAQSPLTSRPQSSSQTSVGSNALTLTAQNVSAEFFAAALGLARPGRPDPSRFHGKVNGSIMYTPQSEGALAAGLKGTLLMPRLEIDEAAPDGNPLALSHLQLVASGSPARPGLLFTGAPIALGVPAHPVSLDAELYQSGYSLHAAGSATLPHLKALAAALQLGNSNHLQSIPGTESTAQLNLSIFGPWLGTTPSEAAAAHTLGSVRLESIQWTVPWLPSPVTFPMVAAVLTPGQVRWSTPEATLGSSGSGSNHGSAAGLTPQAAQLRFAGSAEIPLHCETEGTGLAGLAQPCSTHINIQTASLDIGRLAAILTQNRLPLYQKILNTLDTSQLHLPALEGAIHAATLILGPLPVRDASLVLSTANDPTKGPLINIPSLDGLTLGGNLHAEGALSLSQESAGPKPGYTLHTEFTNIHVPLLAALWQENWGPGTLDATANFTTQGLDTADLLSNLKGGFHATWQNGSLPPALPHFTSWTATGALTPQGLSLTQSTALRESRKEYPRRHRRPNPLGPRPQPGR